MAPPKSDSSSSTSDQDMVTSLEKMPGLLDALGQSAEKAAHETNHAFATIGQMAESQIGTLAAGAFEGYTAAMQKSIETGHISSKALGVAMKQTLKNVLTSIGEESTVKAAFQVAEGVGSLAERDFPAAGQHFEAAGLYLATAAAAGAGAAALGSGHSAGASGSGSSGDGGGDAVTQEVVIIGHLDARDAENLHNQLEAARQSRDLG